MLSDLLKERQNEIEWIKKMTNKTVNDEQVVYQKRESIRKLLLSQINFLKERLKSEIEGRRIADEDIWVALDQYKKMISDSIIAKKNEIEIKPPAPVDKKDKKSK